LFHATTRIRNWQVSTLNEVYGSTTLSSQAFYSNLDYNIRMIKRRGFTLIELLVVISIIGLLSSVVLASVFESRNRAQMARVYSDLRQIEVALELYHQDTGSYPPSYNDNWAGGDGIEFEDPNGDGTGPLQAMFACGLRLAATDYYLASESPWYSSIDDRLAPLVTSGILPSIPHAPKVSKDPRLSYYYTSIPSGCSGEYQIKCGDTIATGYVFSVYIPPAIGWEMNLPTVSNYWQSGFPQWTVSDWPCVGT
jgi:prepilin-type N-terminal cleavage/methylation domain-containing protein